MSVKANQDDLLYREILKIAMRRNRDADQDEKAERERWRESVRALMLRWIEQEAGIVDDDGTLDGYVCACEGQNHAVAKTMAEYAALNANDVAERCARERGLGDTDAELMDADDVEDGAPSRQSSPYQAPPKRQQASGLAALLVPAKRAR